MQPFCMSPHGTVIVTVGNTTEVVTLKAPEAGQVWIDNRGSDDVLVEYLDAPLDADSFRIPGNTGQPLTTPRLIGGSWDGKLRLKRPAGASAGLVYVTSGYGE